MTIAETTGLSDSETDQSSVYSYDRDAEYDIDDQIQARPSDREVPTARDVCIRKEVIESSCTFPSLSSTCNSLRFLLNGYNDPISVSSQIRHQSPLFPMTPIRRTGEVEIQIEVSTDCYTNLKDIEIGLMRCARGTDLLKFHDKYFHYMPLYECSCTFSVYGTLFNSLKHNAFVNVSYSQDRLALLQDVSRIGLKITRDGALEFFVNGQSLGIAAEEVYKLGWRFLGYCSAVDYRPILWLPLGDSKNMATLIAGGKV